jgi:hypothetical protein
VAIGPLSVTFSRLEADGKLVMGYRKAPTSLSSQVRIRNIEYARRLEMLQTIQFASSF